MTPDIAPLNLPFEWVWEPFNAKGGVEVAIYELTAQGTSFCRARSLSFKDGLEGAIHALIMVAESSTDRRISQDARDYALATAEILEKGDLPAAGVFNKGAHLYVRDDNTDPGCPTATFVDADGRTRSDSVDERWYETRAEAQIRVLVRSGACAEIVKLAILRFQRAALAAIFSSFGQAQTTHLPLSVSVFSTTIWVRPGMDIVDQGHLSVIVRDRGSTILHESVTFREAWQSAEVASDEARSIIEDAARGSTTLGALTAQAHATAREKGWWEGTDAYAKFPEKIALIHSELSEALEAYRSGKGFSAYQGEGGKPEGVPSELADVVIRVMDLCGAAGIDLEAAVSAKMAFNKTRPHRHGGKIV